MTDAPADVERAFAFAFLGGAIALGHFRHRNLIVGILLAVAFAALLEAGQNFVPGRHGHMHDFLIKALAVILGAATVWILRRSYPSH
jgi:VanZ family protein